MTYYPDDPRFQKAGEETRKYVKKLVLISIVFSTILLVALGIVTQYELNKNALCTKEIMTRCLGDGKPDYECKVYAKTLCETVTSSILEANND